jgi:hypothetical protein
MLRSLIIFIFLSTSILPSTVLAAKRKSRTQLEQFFSEKGSILVIESKYIGKVFKTVETNISLRIYAVVIYLPGRDDKVIKGIKVSLQTGRTSKVVSTAFIDSSEIPSLFSALLYIMRARPKVKNRKKNIHITYMTKGDFSLGYRQRKSGNYNYYYSISNGLGNIKTTIEIPANGFMLKRMKKCIKKAVKYLNKHHKKIKKPKSIKDSKRALDA